MNEKSKEKNGNLGYIILIIVMFVLLICSFVGIGMMLSQTEHLKEEINEFKDNSKSDDNEIEDKDNVDESGSNNETGGNASDVVESAETASCKFVLGNYVGEFTGNNYHEKTTYGFSSDGKYIRYTENSEGESGTYTVDGKTIKLTHQKMYAPDDIMDTYLMIISDDCKSIVDASDSSRVFYLK